MPASPNPDPAEVSREMRDRALSRSAEDLGMRPSPQLPRVWAVVMETGYAKAVVSLLVVADQTVSLYFSSGGGIIGAGGHASVAAAGHGLLRQVETHLAHFAPAAATPQPELGRVRFYVRTYTGTLTAEASEQDLGYNRHALSPVFHTAHAVISAVREATERQRS